MLVGGFAASQNANAEPVEIDDLKAKMAELAAKLPPAAKKQVSYKKDIEPLFKKSCVNCHGPDKRPKGKFRIEIDGVPFRNLSYRQYSVLERLAKPQ